MRTIVDSARWVLKGHSGAAATIQTLLTRLLILAINMATGIITARTLAPVGRGEQAAMTMWPQFLAFAMTLGLPSALLYNLKRYPDEESKTFSAALVLGTALGIVASLTGVIFIPQWLAQYSAEVIRVAQWFMIATPLILLSAMFGATLEAKGNFTTANQIRYLAPLSTFAMLGVFALTQTLTPLTAGLAYLLPNLPIFFWMLIRLWNHFHPSWRGLITSYKRLLSYGVRSYGIDLLGTLATQVDQVLVVGLLTPASMGMYAVALSLSRMLIVFQSSVITVLFPKTAARPVQEVVAITGRAARLSMVLSLVVSVAAMLLGPVLLRLLYGFEYMGAVPVFRLLLVEVVIGGTGWVLTQAFMALGQPGTVTILQGIGLGLSVPLMLLLIPVYGLVGVGLSVLCSTTIRFIFTLISFPLILKVRPPSLLLTREDVNFMKQILRFNQ
jgi:O-antigen/teichoic acid export membrane protein